MVTCYQQLHRRNLLDHLLCAAIVLPVCM